MIPKDSHMNDYYTFSLHHFVRALDKFADEYLAQNFSISYSRFLCLVAIYNNEKSTQHEIAEWLQVSDAVVSRMLKPLLDNGYVVIENDPQHKLRRKVSPDRYRETNRSTSSQKTRGTIPRARCAFES